jgi:hypothetical protein
LSKELGLLRPTDSAAVNCTDLDPWDDQWPLPWMPAWAAVASHMNAALVAAVKTASSQLRARRLIGELAFTIENR